MDTFSTGLLLWAVMQFPTVEEYEKRNRKPAAPAAETRPVAVEGDTTVFRVETRVVNVTFSAATDEGKRLGELKKEDVLLKEDGQLRPVQYFSRDRDTPLTLGIVVDLSPSQKGLFRRNQRAALTFLQQTLTPKDRVFLVTFGEGTRLVQRETSSLAEVEATFREWDSAFNDSVLWNKRRGSPIYTTLLECTRRVMSEREGRKAILLISDGVDSGSRDSADSATEFLQTHDTIVYWMKTDNMMSQAGGLGGLIGRIGDGRKARQVREISEDSGGRVFEEDSLEKQFREIELELRTLYSIGFSPERDPDGRIHQLEIRLKNNKARIRHKPSYRDETP
jgi:VWFA-related protein